MEDVVANASAAVVPPSPAGELSDQDLEVVVGGLTRAWVGWPSEAPSPLPTIPGGPAGVVLKHSI